MERTTEPRLVPVVRVKVHVLVVVQTVKVIVLDAGTDDAFLDARFGQVRRRSFVANPVLSFVCRRLDQERLFFRLRLLLNGSVLLALEALCQVLMAVFAHKCVFFEGRTCRLSLEHISIFITGVGLLGSIWLFGLSFY